MTAYDSINQVEKAGHRSDNEDLGARRSSRAKWCTLIVAILLVLTVAAYVIVNIRTKQASSPLEQTRVSLAAVTERGIYRPPIGGRLDCDASVLAPSAISPDDANRVRPADIKYIAAMGDSYATAFLSFSREEDVSEDDTRNVVGNSFVMGGDGQMENHLTLANVLAHLNPSLVGASIGRGMAKENTNLMVAVPGKWVSDMPRQARELVLRMREHSDESIRNDWKLINIFVGTNDIGAFCRGDIGTTKLEYKRNLTEAIDILQEALPKTIISLIGMTNLDFMWRAPTIVTGERVECAVANFDVLAQRRIEQYREVHVEAASNVSLHSRKDQIVIAQHIFDDLWSPLKNPDGTYHTDFYARDTFHISNFGNSLIAKQLWNHLISAEYEKITLNEHMADERPQLKCLEMNCPFIRTPLNSVACV